MNPIPLLVASKPILQQNTLYVDPSFNPLADTLTGGMIHKLMTAANIKTLSSRAYEKQLAKFEALSSHTWEDMCALFRLTVDQAAQLLRDNYSHIKKLQQVLSPRRCLGWKTHLRSISRMYAAKEGRAKIQAYTAKFHYKFFGCFSFVTERCKKAITNIVKFITGRRSNKSFDEKADEYIAQQERTERLLREAKQKVRIDALSKRRKEARKKIELEQEIRQLKLRRAPRA